MTMRCVECGHRMRCPDEFNVVTCPCGARVWWESFTRGPGEPLPAWINAPRETSGREGGEG